MSDLEPEFQATEMAKPLFEDARKKLSEASMSLFFGLWDAGHEPRQAGSMVAHILLPLAARSAAFGAHCAETTPSRELWLKRCNEAFERAVAEIDDACVLADNDYPLKEPDSRGSSPPSPRPRDAATGGESPAAGAVPTCSELHEG